MHTTTHRPHRRMTMIRGAALAACMGCVGLGFPAAQVSEEERVAREAEQRRIASARMSEASREARRSQITTFNRDMSESHTIGEPVSYSWPVYSPDGSRIAFLWSSEIGIVLRSSDIGILDVETGRVSRLTQSAAGEGHQDVTWSHDGREVAFVAWSGSRYSIYRQLVDGGAGSERELVYSHEGGSIHLGDWSRDGRYLAFSSGPRVGAGFCVPACPPLPIPAPDLSTLPAGLDLSTGGPDDSEGRLFVLDLEGNGKPVVVAEADTPMILPRFSPDDQYLSYLSIDKSGPNHHVTPARADRQDTWRLSPNGTSSAGFWDADGSAFYHIDNERRLMSISVDTDGDNISVGEERHVATLPDAVADRNFLITGSTATPFHTTFTMSRDAEHLLFGLAPRPEPQQIAVLDRQGREIARLGEPALYDQPSFSPDGSRILVQRIDTDRPGVIWGTGIHVIDPASGAITLLADGPGVGFLQAVAWMHDGAHVAYSRSPVDPALGNHSQIYSARTDGQGEAAVLFRSTTGVMLQLMDVSRDGEYLAFDSFGWLATVRLTGHDPLAREALDLVRAEFEGSAPRFSPDSRLVAYLYNETGRRELYVAPFDGETGTTGGSERHQVSTDGAAGGLSWRDDGTELYYLSEMLDTPELNDFRVMAVSVTLEPVLEFGEPRTLFEITLPSTVTTGRAGTGTLPLWQNVSGDGEHFVFVVPASSGD